MFDLNPLFEFSRTYCIPICATLVPANLLATLQTMLFAAFGRSTAQVQLMAIGASFYALLLLLHVFTWFAIGIVMAPTFILTFLGCLCLCMNFCAVLYKKRQELNPQRFSPLEFSQIWKPGLKAETFFSNPPTSK